MGGMRKMNIHENEKHSMSWPMTRNAKNLRELDGHS